MMKTHTEAPVRLLIAVGVFAGVTGWAGYMLHGFAQAPAPVGPPSATRTIYQADLQRLSEAAHEVFLSTAGLFALPEDGTPPDPQVVRAYEASEHLDYIVALHVGPAVRRYALGVRLQDPHRRARAAADVAMALRELEQSMADATPMASATALRMLTQAIAAIRLDVPMTPPAGPVGARGRPSSAP
jgi:hypothetical protein